MKKFLIGIFLLAVLGGGALYFYLPKMKLSSLRQEMDSKNLNVVFVLIDTLRADHLPFYGYKLDTAPFISELSKKAVVFNRAISASAWTVPSVASLITSKHPSEHGVIMGFFATKRLQENNQTVKLNRIPEDLETMAEYFSDNGYLTVGVTDNWNISEKLGFEQGFQKFKNYSFKRADVVNQTVENFLNEVPENQKYFLYLHYMDPHSPYVKKDNWYVEPDNADRKTKTVARYDSNIGFVDSKLKELYEKYRWDENALVIITSDHGESFWEHGIKGHGKTLYREETHIPLLILHPNKRSETRVEEPVGHVDILPTMADILSLPQREQWSGKTVLPAVAGASTLSNSTLSELLFLPDYPKTQYQSTLKENKKVLKYVDEPGKYATFDWYKDPKEKSPEIIDSAHPMAIEMEGFLKSLKEEARESEEFDLHEDALEHLKTLGYVQ